VCEFAGEVTEDRESTCLPAKVWHPARRQFTTMANVALSLPEIARILRGGSFVVSADLAYENNLGRGYEIVSIATDTGDINICGIMTEKNGWDDIEILGISTFRASGEQSSYYLRSPRILIGIPRAEHGRNYVSGFVMYDGAQAVFGVVASDFSVYLDILADAEKIDSALHRRDLSWEFLDAAV